MYIFPAIDLYDKKAVRLLKGDYNNMTVYSDNPVEIARDFENQGACSPESADADLFKSSSLHAALQGALCRQPE